MFGFDLLVDELRDGRERPQIPTRNVWLCGFAMFVMRIQSLNAFEQELRRAGWMESFVGTVKPSADTIGRVHSVIDVDRVRLLLVKLNRVSWRSKSIHFEHQDSYRVVAVDGHELSASRSRCCSSCLKRKVKDGKKRVTEYYHKVVVAQWTGVTPPSILDLEMVRAGEGEVIAAKRLIERVTANYSRLIDVFTADALYLEAPFIRAVLAAKKHVVIVMKQENRELFQDAERLRTLIDPQVIVDGERTTRLWDISDLSSFSTLGRKVRVVWAEEETTVKKIVGGKPQTVVDQSRWIWVTDLTTASVPATTIQRWGHGRWELENRGFNELSNLWHMNHCFVHHPNAITALLLTLAIAFLATYLFYERNLKPEARRYMTRLAMVRRFVEDLVSLNGESLWSAQTRPG